MCIIYSSYIQHLTNKHKERQTTEKAPLEVRHNEGGSFLSASGFLCLLHTLANYCLKWLQPRLQEGPPVSGKMEARAFKSVTLWSPCQTSKLKQDRKSSGKKMFVGKIKKKEAENFPISGTKFKPLK